MDVRLQGNPQRVHGVTAGAAAAVQNPRTAHDDRLLFLSQEEKECIQFFEKTIDSLEETLEDESHRTLQARRRPLQDMDPGHRVGVSGTTGHREQDIIDLVRPGPDLVQTRDQVFSPMNPDFQSLLLNPESHFEVKPRHDPMDGLPSEYNPPLPSGSYGPSDTHSYHPPGCIPTPVLIAQKIAENQGSGSTNMHPSALLRHLSLESEPTEPQGKHGPPTAAKPPRFPANISVVLGNKENQNQSVQNMSLEDRRAQMLANLSGASVPLQQEDSLPAVENSSRNSPGRSISFKDPTPNKSRMEALSKLGLDRNRALSGGVSLLDTPDGVLLKTPTGLETEGGAAMTYSVPEVASPNLSNFPVERKPEILRSDSRRSYEERSPQPSPSPTMVSKSSSYYPSSLDNRTPVPPPPEVTSIEINSYGGKSIVVNPLPTPRNEFTTTHLNPEPRSPPHALATSYEVKPKPMNAVPVPLNRSDLPDILSSHIDKSRAPPSQPEPPPIDPNSFGGTSKTIQPSPGPTGRHPKGPAPITAPRPARYTHHAGVAPLIPASRTLSPDHKRRNNSLFRPQSISVEFCGQGPMDEARRTALRKLGLLKEPRTF